ncbi:SUMF1/EgtB/PvdO family nonheme iron enzyme [Lacrimispora brassicae]
MPYQSYYSITDWKNLPSQQTALNRTNLIHAENGIKEADNRIVQLDSKKAEQALVNTMVKDVSVDTNTGVLTITLLNGTTKTYDLDIEKVVVNFDITDDDKLVLTLADGTQKIIDLTRFVYSVDSTATISMQIQDRTITARIVDGSVTMEKLDAAIQTEFRQYMLDAQAARDAALQYQLWAKRYTLGDVSFPGSETDSSKYYYEQTKTAEETTVQNAQSAAEDAETATQQAGIAKQKAINASASETNAAASAQIATQKATAAAVSEQTAKEKADETVAATTTATQKAAAASTSEANAKTYMDESKSNADHAKSEADRAESYAGQANPGALTGTEATDTRGILGAPGATVWAQALIDRMIDNNISDIEIDDLDELVYIPKFKSSDVLVGGDNNTHPAFIVHGKEIPGFYYSKYQNVVKTVNGVSTAYSLYGKDPAVNINFDNARAICEAKGNGYHLSTMAEWAAIALWCKKNGCMPYGNNDYGKDTHESGYMAVPVSQEDDGRTAKVATGTGPLTWSHDETPSGIWDLNGNIWEWQGGVRAVWGEIQVLENNNAADPANSQAATSEHWKAINAVDGTLVEPESKTTDTAAHLSGNTLKLDYVTNTWRYTTNVTSNVDQNRSFLFHNLTTTSEISEAARVRLRALALLPDLDAVAADYEGDRFYFNNGRSESMFQYGGRWNNATTGGIFCVLGESSRASGSVQRGLRCAYIPELGKLL